GPDGSRPGAPGGWGAPNQPLRMDLLRLAARGSEHRELQAPVRLFSREEGIGETATFPIASLRITPPVQEPTQSFLDFFRNPSIWCTLASVAEHPRVREGPRGRWGPPRGEPHGTGAPVHNQRHAAGPAPA